MKLFWILPFAILLSTLCIGSTLASDDNEFAEFEDEFVEVVTDSPHIEKHEERVPPQRVEPPVQRDDFEDEDFGIEGNEPDEHVEIENPAETDAGDRPPEPLKFTDVPAHFRSNWASYQVEGVVVLIIAIYLLNYLIGKTTNSSIAHTVFEMCRPALEEQFSVVGDDGTTELDKLESGLKRDTDSTFSAWCTGRVNVNSLYLQMKMVKRQDLVSRVIDLFEPTIDRMSIKCSLESSPDCDPLIFAVGEKKIATKQFKEMLDLNSFVSERKQTAQQFNLPASWQLYADQNEVVFSILEPGVVSLFKKHEDAIEFIHISDQYTGPKPAEGESYTKLPEPQRFMHVSLNMKALGTDEETVAEVLNLVFYLIDKARKLKLSKDAKVKAERRRKEFEDAFMKQTHQFRQEAAQARREEKTRERKQKLMDENDPDRQKRLEAKELKREAKAKQPKMKQLKVKMEKNNFRRYNPLIDEWIIVAVNRINRPWQGAKTEKATSKTKSAEDPKPSEKNPLAPGGTRSSGVVNEQYQSIYVFSNDFPSFTEFEECAEREEDGNLFKQKEVRGTCKVICYHPDSQLTLATMDIGEVRAVVDIWHQQYVELGAKYEWVQIFENRGAVVGCSNMHPHGQLWASDYLPTLPAKKHESQKKYLEKHGKVMLVDYLEQEIVKNERIILRNAHWTWLVPFWAFWPYETMLLPNRHVQRFTDLTEAEKQSLAEMLRALLIRYDNVFECSFPYMMGWSCAPTGSFLSEDCSHWQTHLSLFPPLLRSATVPKFLAGYEVFAEKQRDISPEMAAKTLREIDRVHYSKK
ncbi:unnamed protein product [Caenorhabditis sp. 36 PRJEB53466]|nr:unnamed protein product [Caenorhabditis sp. 36 PRJEB53466]